MAINPPPDPPPPPLPLPRFGALVWLGFILLVLSLALLWTMSGTEHKVAIVRSAFLLDLAAVALIVVGLGAVVSGIPLGFMLASRNAYSLSKLQMALWTILVLGAVLTAAEVNILGFFGPMPPVDPKDPAQLLDPLAINIPGDLLAAMGIAAFSLGAVPALLSIKGSQTPTADQTDAATQRVAANTGADPAHITNVGNLIARTDKIHARLSDIVTGDELANAGTVDLSKVQQLLITLLLLSVYIGALLLAFGKAIPITTLPPLGERFVELLAISHGGYLAYKAVPKSGQPTN